MSQEEIEFEFDITIRKQELEIIRLRLALKEAHALLVGGCNPQGVAERIAEDLRGQLKVIYEPTD